MDIKSIYLDFFRQADVDGNNYLDLEELIGVMRKKGYKGTDEEIKTMFKKMDTSGDDRVSMDEYLFAMEHLPEELHKQACMRAVFKTFDRDGNGEVDSKELKTVFTEMGTVFSDEEVGSMIDYFDEDKSGTVSYEEFIAKMFPANA